VRTYVRMFVIFDPARPHIALNTAEALKDIADALVARPESGLIVCVNQDGLTRNLDAGEQRELDARLDALRWVTGA
jgi:hypothetical protein